LDDSLKQRAHRISYELDSPVSVPFCSECHSYPCACDDNIMKRYLLDSTKAYREHEDNWPTLRYGDPGMSFDRFK